MVNSIVCFAIITGYLLIKFRFFFKIKRNSCPFCDSQVIEKQLVYDGSKVQVLYCLTPAALGNLLIIPKRHITRFEHLDKEELEEVHRIVGDMLDVFKDLYALEDYILIQKNGSKAGQTVFHTHFHMIPSSDSIKPIIDRAFENRNHIDDKEMAQRTQEIQSAIKRLGIT